MAQWHHKQSSSKFIVIPSAFGCNEIIKQPEEGVAHFDQFSTPMANEVDLICSRPS
jgi:hypothetical protein